MAEKGGRLRDRSESARASLLLFNGLGYLGSYIFSLFSGFAVIIAGEVGMAYGTCSDGSPPDSGVNLGLGSRFIGTRETS